MARKDEVTRQRTPWFAARRTGYGTGLPIVWQGWLSLALFIAVILIAPIALPPSSGLPLVVVAVIAFAAICIRRTEGGWRWRR